MTRLARFPGAFACLSAVVSAPLMASAAEQIDQLEPDGGEWQAEYFGSYGGGNAHVIETLYGVSDRLALGGEIEVQHEEGEWEKEFGLAALVRLNDPETAPLGIGIQGELGVNSNGDFAEAEGRLIAERKRGRWWGQANLMLRHQREGGERGTGLAYAASLAHAPAEWLWIAVEASGRLAHLSGAAELAPRGEHYLGPTALAELDLAGGGEVEIGAGWLFRIDGDGPDAAPRLFVQFGF